MKNQHRISPLSINDSNHTEYTGIRSIYQIVINGFRWGACQLYDSGTWLNRYIIC